MRDLARPDLAFTRAEVLRSSPGFIDDLMVRLADYAKALEAEREALRAKIERARAVPVDVIEYFNDWRVYDAEAITAALGYAREPSNDSTSSQ